jgi:transposase
LWITSTSAKGNEKNQALILLNQIIAIRLKNNRKMTICEADKGYDADSFRQFLLQMNYLPVIGYRKHRKEIISTTEISNFFGFNRKRWVVERTFSWLKRKCRRLLMRWERLANLWEAFSKLGLIYMWLGYLVG